MEIATAFVTIRPETSGFEAELASAVGGVPDQEITLTADADTSAAVDAVESVPDGEVEVTANTEQAEAALDQVTEKVQDATESTSALGDAATGALGGMGGLGGAAGGAASGLGATAAAGAGAAAGLFTFAQAAIDAESASQRFELVTGGLGDSVQSIDVGGLSGDIGELALRLGSSDEAMLNATASFVTFAQSTGAGNDEIIAASDNINALALRAVALNPGLGDAGAVAERMTNALARGGRATTQFGIGLTSAEINARAMADTGKENVSELTQFEKAAAGAEIAVERLGNTMGEDFAAGSQNARTEWNRMTEQLGEAAETTGGVMLPAIENITNAVTELGSGIANLSPRDWLSGLWDLSGGLIANGVTDLWSAISGGEQQISGVATLVGELPPSLRETAAAAAVASGDVDALSQSLDDYLQSLFGVPDAQRDLRQSFGDLATAMSEGTWDDQAVAMENVVGATAAMIAKQREQGATTRELDATIYGSIATLARMRDQGQITGAQFDRLSGQIRDVPHEATTVVSTPGAAEAINNLRTVKTTIDGIARDVVVRVSVPNLGAIAADVAGAASALRSLRGAESASAGGAALTRPSIGAGPATTVVHQTVLDGRVLTETVNDINYAGSIAEGYEP